MQFETPETPVQSLTTASTPAPKQRLIRVTGAVKSSPQLLLTPGMVNIDTTIAKDELAITHTAGLQDALDAKASVSSVQDEIVARAQADTAETSARVQALSDEATTRAQADASETAARQLADTTEHDARVAADSAETTARQKGDTDEATARVAGDTTEKNARIQAVSDEATARSTADTAETTARVAGDNALGARLTAVEGSTTALGTRATTSETASAALKARMDAAEAAITALTARAQVRKAGTYTTASTGIWTGTVPAGVRLAVVPRTANVMGMASVSGTTATVAFTRVKSGGLGLTLGTLLTATILEPAVGEIVFDLIAVDAVP